MMVSTYNHVYFAYEIASISLRFQNFFQGSPHLFLCSKLQSRLGAYLLIHLTLELKSDPQITAWVLFV